MMKRILRWFKNILCWPLEIIVLLVIFVRNLLFDLKILKTRQFSTPIVCVGNLSMGGTGKTPHVAHLIQNFLGLKKRVAVVSRGYGGTYGGYATKVNVDEESAAAIYGDEPVFYAKKFSIPVYVAHDRSAAVELCISQEHPDVIISDDGFQHRWMGRSTDIVLIDSTDTQTALFPRGRLRETFSSLRRAHFVVLTKTNLIDSALKTHWLEVLETKGFSLNQKNLFVSQFHIKSIDIFRGVTEVAESSRVFLASSIAVPGSFAQTLQSRFEIAHHFSYPDHYQWQQKDIDKIEAQAVKNEIKDLLITEKDAVKLDTLVFRYLQVHVVKLSLSLQPELPYDKLV